MRTKQITVNSSFLSFSGYVDDAHELVVHIRKIHDELSIDIPKDLNDFIFAIEVRLQSIGYLTENFDVDPDYAEA